MTGSSASRCTTGDERSPTCDRPNALSAAVTGCGSSISSLIDGARIKAIWERASGSSSRSRPRRLISERKAWIDAREHRVSELEPGEDLDAGGSFEIRATTVSGDIRIRRASTRDASPV